MPKAKDELDEKDIKFLKAVQELCDNPEEHEATEAGEAPANTTSIKKLPWVELSSDDLSYRMRKDKESGPGKRGFEVDGGMGLIRIYDPPITENGYGPRSCDITDKGREALADALEKRDYPLSAGLESLPEDTRMEVAGLREELRDLATEVQELRQERDELRDEVESLKEIVTLWQEQRFGAVDEEDADRLSSVLKAIPAFMEIDRKVFGIDPKEFGRETDLSEDDYDRKREQVVETLDSSR